jgi:riboflavin synthase
MLSSMFTGIITDVGHVAAIERRGDTLFSIATAWDTDGIALGASIACNGACLTVVDRRPGRFDVEASAETLSMTTLGDWTVGTRVNLERALRLGDELGGHLVSGHVDGVATVVSVRPEGGSHRIVFEVPAPLARFVAAKGSVALDGVSLTVNEVEDTRFGVNIIPHTLQWTSFRGVLPGTDGPAFGPGRRVNFEIDMLARYLQRLVETR